MTKNSKTTLAHANTTVHKHWHYLYRHRRRHNAKANTSQMAISQVISLVGSIAAGLLLDANKDTLALLTGAFIVLPGVFDLDGSIGATISAKISHQYENVKRPLALAGHVVIHSILLSAAAGLIVAIVGGIVARVFFDADFTDVAVLAWGAIIASGMIGFPIVALLSVLFASKGVNPDDVIGPIESSMFDILTVITLTFMIGIIL